MTRITYILSLLYILLFLCSLLIAIITRNPHAAIATGSAAFLCLGAAHYHEWRHHE